MKVLAIETSCDETAVAILKAERLDRPIQVCSNVVYSQIGVHRKFGGVYPEAASREHVRKIGPVLLEALRQFAQKELGMTNDTLQTVIRDQIDLIAVTVGPGLIGSLLVGVNAAKTLAYAFGKPILGVNHHEGHIAAAWLISRLSEMTNSDFRVPKLPAVALVVSGGHTTLVFVPAIGQLKVIGATRDDAVGEAFDKVARLLGLPYPGGPAIAAWAATQAKRRPKTVIRRLPRPMLNSLDFDFSFSGLKTAVLEMVRDQKRLTAGTKAAIAHEFQEAAIEVLVTKTVRAVEKFHPQSLIIAGGVAANQRLREAIELAISDMRHKLELHIPPNEYCTDNAAMIGAAAALRALSGESQAWQEIHADDSLRLGVSAL